MMKFWHLPLSYLLSMMVIAGSAQTKTVTPSATASGGSATELRYVVYLSRHGVRSPTGKAAQYNLYSIAPWPDWPVQPGYLTPHGFHLMEIFGSYDRTLLIREGLLHDEGCSDAQRMTFYADSDQRTRETGKALAQGLMPGCNVSVQALPEGTNDNLFHSSRIAGGPTPALARAAIAGRIGGDPANVTLAYRQEISALDTILATCGSAPLSKVKRTSLFDLPSSLSEGTGDHLADMKGPINTASTLSENLLLEYTEGMDETNVGWGCVHRKEIQALMTLHTAATDFTQRTPEIAKAQSAHLLQHIGLSIQQAVDQKPTPGALGKPADNVLFLIGHDTNLENIAGALGLTWIIDGRRDDTPPGSALIFEVWQQRSSGTYFVRTYFTAQTLDQMRTSAQLTEANPPDRVPVFIPACSDADMSCKLSSFLQTLSVAKQ